MKIIIMNLLILSTLFSAEMSVAGVKVQSEMILKKDLAVVAKSSKEFGRRDINDSKCGLVVNNHSNLDLIITKGTILVVDNIMSGRRRLDPSYADAEAITHIYMHIQNPQNDLEKIENLDLSLSCESGIYNNVSDARDGYVPPKKAVSMFDDFLEKK